MVLHTPARRAAGLVLAAALLLVGCSDDADSPTGADPSSTSPSPSASPSPTQALRPVLGERTTTVLPLGSRPLLGLGGNPEPDQAAIESVVDAVGDWLDAHLDELQRTGQGLWGTIAADGLADADQRGLVATDLASPDQPVERARYLMTVYVDGAPEYVTTRVEVGHPDGSASEVGLVFVVAGDGTPRLSMFGPEPAAKAAP